MNHSEILETVASKFKTKPSKIDKIVEEYFLAAAKACQEDLQSKRDKMKNKMLLTCSDSITNENVGSIWVKLEKGENGRNSLGGIEKALYPKLKIRFSKSFIEKAFIDPNPKKETE